MHVGPKDKISAFRGDLVIDIQTDVGRARESGDAAHRAAALFVYRLCCC
jgi:hypothetical protein